MGAVGGMRVFAGANRRDFKPHVSGSIWGMLSGGNETLGRRVPSLVSDCGGFASSGRSECTWVG